MVLPCGCHSTEAIYVRAPDGSVSAKCGRCSTENGVPKRDLIEAWSKELDVMMETLRRKVNAQTFAPIDWSKYPPPPPVPWRTRARWWVARKLKPIGRWLWPDEFAWYGREDD